jgi:hypothetical protein
VVRTKAYAAGRRRWSRSSVVVVPGCDRGVRRCAAEGVRRAADRRRADELRQARRRDGERRHEVLVGPRDQQEPRRGGVRDARRAYRRRRAPRLELRLRSRAPPAGRSGSPRAPTSRSCGRRCLRGRFASRSRPGPDRAVRGASPSSTRRDQGGASCRCLTHTGAAVRPLQAQDRDGRSPCRRP